MKSTWRQTTFATCAPSLYPHLQQDRCVPVRAELVAGWAEEVGRPEKSDSPDCPDPGALTSGGQGEPALHPGGLPCHQTAEQRVIHTVGSGGEQRETAVAPWRILLFGRPSPRFCPPFSTPPTPSASFTQWRHDNGPFSLGGGMEVEGWGAEYLRFPLVGCHLFSPQLFYLGRVCDLVAELVERATEGGAAGAGPLRAAGFTHGRGGAPPPRTPGPPVLPHTPSPLPCPQHGVSLLSWDDFASAPFKPSLGPFDCFHCFSRGDYLLCSLPPAA